MFAQRLKTIRTERNVNQKQLAEAMGVTQGTIGNWETAKRAPDLVMVGQLAEFFAVSVDFLLGRDTSEGELILLSRKLAAVPEEDREFLMGSLNNAVDVYFKTKGITTTED
jgi:transcriptional regulator with XRE-family HTH domain